MMTLTDTGPLLALLDKDDPNHAVCIAAARRLPAGPLATTWPCFIEAMYLLGEVGGYNYQRALWRLRNAHKLILLDLTIAETDRMAELMDKYQDTPMNLADASLVAIIENRGLNPVFTLDSDFCIYRLRDGSAIMVIPIPDKV